MNDIYGNIFEISRFRYDDGPGIRTVIFLKGCPLACVWCHNPESLDSNIQIFFDQEKCVLCKACMHACRKSCHSIVNEKHVFDRTNCDLCMDCVNACCFSALSSVGKKISIEEAIDEAVKDKPFYDVSGGGVTISGGEPTYQYKFTLNTLKKLKEIGINTAIETNGFTQTELFENIITYCDYILFDCKAVNENKHIRFVGASNDLIMKNLRRADKMNKKIILRAPIVPDCNDSKEDLLAIANLSKTLKNLLYIEIMPYHPLGISKCKNLGIEPKYNNTSFPSEETINEWQKTIVDNTDKTVYSSTSKKSLD